ncbi:MULTISPECIES: DUF554 family protein [Aphanothece]|uniref:DUF554 family protein n=1 Tax=Aphanothece TaxID=1121 RepID=UPI003985095E
MVFWEATSGTWINVLAVLAGSLLGVGLGGHLSAAIRLQWQRWLGIITLLLALQMVQPLWDLRLGAFPAVLAALVVLVLGSWLGELVGLQRRLDRWLLRFAAPGGGRSPADGGERSPADIVSGAFVLFCIGPITLLGCLRNGALGDPSLLLVKAGLDGLSAAVLASGVGLVLLWVLVPLAVLQLGLSGLGMVLAGGVMDPSGSPLLLFTSAVGGLLVLALALDLLDLPHPSVVNGLAALVLAPALGWGIQP